jgi:hypothetical protein
VQPRLVLNHVLGLQRHELGVPAGVGGQEAGAQGHRGRGSVVLDETRAARRAQRLPVAAKTNHLCGLRAALVPSLPPT